MSTEQDIQDIELNIEQARAFVKANDALNRLMENPDFKEVIREGYFKDEAVRLVELKAAPQMGSEESQQYILKALDGIGSLQQYFNTIWHLGEQAKVAIDDGNEQLANMDAAA